VTSTAIAKIPLVASRHDTPRLAVKQSCAPTNWWSAAALGGLMTGCAFFIGGGGGVALWSAAAA